MHKCRKENRTHSKIKAEVYNTRIYRDIQYGCYSAADYNLIAAIYWLAVWPSGNTLASINVVVLRQTRSVLGWVTVCGRVNHLGM